MARKVSDVMRMQAALMAIKGTAESALTLVPWEQEVSREVVGLLEEDLTFIVELAGKGLAAILSEE